MTRAARVADAMAQQHGPDPSRVAERLGVLVATDDLPSPYREVYFKKNGVAGVIVSSRASSAEARALIAHGLAHHVLHTGDRVSGTSPALWSGRHEREADDFAACLLVPSDQVDQWCAQVDPPTSAEIAERLDVPERLVRRRIQLASEVDRQPA